MTSGARLTHLDLSDNAFGPDGVKGIESLLKSSACYTLRELRLNNCGMGIGGGMVSLGHDPLYVSSLKIMHYHLSGYDIRCLKALKTVLNVLIFFWSS